MNISECVFGDEFGGRAERFVVSLTSTIYNEELAACLSSASDLVMDGYGVPKIQIGPMSSDQ